MMMVMMMIMLVVVVVVGLTKRDISVCDDCILQ